MSLLLLYRPRSGARPGGGFAVHVPGQKKRRKKRIFYVVKTESGRKHEIEATEVDYAAYAKTLFDIRKRQVEDHDEDLLLLQMMLEEII